MTDNDLPSAKVPCFAITISGRIGSGKSALASRLTSETEGLDGWETISFGRHVQSLAAGAVGARRTARKRRFKDSRSLFTYRRKLQATGQAELTTLHPLPFLRTVIEAVKPWKPVTVFDGLRHTGVLDAIRTLYNNRVLVVYLDVERDERYRRYNQKLIENDLPTIDKGQFDELDRATVESEVELFKTNADVVGNQEDVLEIIAARVVMAALSKEYPGTERIGLCLREVESRTQSDSVRFHVPELSQFARSALKSLGYDVQLTSLGQERLEAVAETSHAKIEQGPPYLQMLYRWRVTKKTHS